MLGAIALVYLMFSFFVLYQLDTIRHCFRGVSRWRLIKIFIVVVLMPPLGYYLGVRLARRQQRIHQLVMYHASTTAHHPS